MWLIIALDPEHAVPDSTKDGVDEDKMFDEWVQGRYERPEWVERAVVIRTLRRRLSQRDTSADEWLAASSEPTLEPGDYDGLCRELLLSNLPADSPYTQHAMTLRHQVLRAMVRKNARLEQKRKDALSLFDESFEFFCGWERLLDVGSQYQLGSATPWYKPGDPILHMDTIAESTPAELEQAGFKQIEPDAYQRCVQRSILSYMLAMPDQQHAELEWFACALVLLVRSIKEWKRSGIKRLVEVELAALKTRCIRTLGSMQHARIPMQPLYSLPRESNTIQSLMLVRSSSSQDETSYVEGNIPGTGFKVLEDRGQQLGLFFDRKLVRRKSSNDETFISVPVQAKPNTDIVQVLMQAFEHFEIKSTVFEHLPRIVAGMFAAAHRDKFLDLGYEGAFWDTESGYRLCQIIGFDPNNSRHRKRITDARSVLQAFRLHRSVTTTDDVGNKTTVALKAPLIEARAAELELTIEQRDGLNECHRLRSWSINPHLWRMTVYEDEGGAPAFMMLDERAFTLDDRSSVPFNIYWTLINRAYMSGYTGVAEDRVDDSGCFSPKLGVLYDWAGLETAHAKAKRVKKQFREAFAAMQSRGLLVSWECPELDDEHSIGLEQLKATRVTLQLPPEQVEVFRPKAMLGHSDAKLVS